MRSHYGGEYCPLDEVDMVIGVVVDPPIDGDEQLVVQSVWQLLIVGHLL